MPLSFPSALGSYHSSFRIYHILYTSESVTYYYDDHLTSHGVWVMASIYKLILTTLNFLFFIRIKYKY